MPIFEQAAHELAKWQVQPDKVCLARVDCVAEAQLSQAMYINKFPTLRLYHRGHPLRREFRGQRSVQALVDFVQKQFRQPFSEFQQLEQLDSLNPTRRAVLAFFENRTQPAFVSFELLMERLKNDCDFYVRFGDKLANISYTQLMPTLVYRPDVERTHAQDELYAGNVNNVLQLESWLYKKCLPLVRQVDFSNVEEIIEQRLPLVVLFHMPNDLNAVKDFKSIVEMQLADCKDCGSYNFVTVDGLKFKHSVAHMGKTEQDLPIIAIDTLQFTFPYPKFKDIYIPGHLKQFIKHLSEHRKQLKLKIVQQSTEQLPQLTPPSSTFKELGPSRHRYTLVERHDEL
ncbi:CG9911 [Drosophila busckii]|uniref:CG9911 n=2 Tax=Drosophila busckii TaxID=30019 RepID=A0A0M4EB39_DROBS|nr:endoplasmic reticulum resident protein 44-like [Drosophila busckii]ALC39738.1 CG9911 [Drosophila busckii]